MQLRGARRGLGVLLVLTLTAIASGCGGSTPAASTSDTSVSTPATTTTVAKPQAKAKNRRARAKNRSKRATCAKRLSSHCPPASRVLAGVYHPDRLTVLARCKRTAGTVATVRHEEDGDIHIDVNLDSAYRGMLAAGNKSAQHGDLVVEFMPRDAGHLPSPSVGDRIRLLGAFVDDTQHGWNEIHPVWGVALNGEAWHYSGPQYGGSPPEARSPTAQETCRTKQDRQCGDYSGSDSGTAKSSAPPSSPKPSSPSGASGSGCAAGYSPCLHVVDD